MLLEHVREKTKGWVTWIIVPAIAVIFALWGIENFFGITSRGNTIAKVGEVEVTKVSFGRYFDNIMYQMGHNDIGSNPEVRKLMEQYYLKQFTKSIAFNEYLKSLGFVVGDEQIRTYLSALEVFKEDGKFNTERFNAVLRRLHYRSANEYFDDLKRQLVQDQFFNGIKDAQHIPSKLMGLNYMLIKQERQYKYLPLPLDTFKKYIKVSDEQLNNYFNERKMAYQVPEKVSIDYLLLSTKNLASLVKISDTEAKKFYDTHQAAYKVPARYKLAHIFVSKLEADEKVKAIKAGLKKGQAFTKLKKKYDTSYSEGDSAKPEWISHFDLDPKVVEALKGLKDKAVTREPIETDRGYVFIQRVGYDKEHTKPFAKVRAEIISRLKQERGNKAFSTKYELLDEIAFANPNSLTPASKELDLPIQSTKLFSRNNHAESDKEILSHEKVVSAAFSQDVLKEKNNSELIQLDSETYVVIRIKEHRPSYIPKLADIKKRVREDLIRSEATLLAKQVANNYMVSDKAKRATLLKKYKLSWTKEKFVARDQNGVNPAVLKKLFELAKPSSGRATYMVTIPGGDYGLISYLAVKLGQYQDITETEKEAFATQVDRDQQYLITRSIEEKADQAFPTKRY